MVKQEAMECLQTLRPDTARRSHSWQRMYEGDSL